MTLASGAIFPEALLLRGYWVSYYRLRRLTMSDFERMTPITR